jgi:hypothetical protein
MARPGVPLAWGIDEHRHPGIDETIRLHEFFIQRCNIFYVVKIVCLLNIYVISESLWQSAG